MKLLHVIFVAVFLGFTFEGLCQSNDIIALEYYVDIDPGIGSGTQLTITPGPEIDQQFTIPVSLMGLSPGFHLLVIRSMDSQREWGMYEQRVFYIQEDAGAPPLVPSDVTALEYFIDEDPGVGMATEVAITPGSEIDINEFVSSIGLNDGFHSVGVRARNENGSWGFTERRLFYIQNEDAMAGSPSDVRAVEYFIDEDPGHGNATELLISPGQEVDFSEMLDGTGLDNGYHNVSVRAMNADGNWGMNETRVFYIQSSNSNVVVSPITALEYFIDEDPGAGMGTLIPISPSMNEVDILSTPGITGGGLTIGEHTLTIRGQNADGSWGHRETITFEVDGDCPIANFAIQNACIEEEILLTNNSTGVLGIAEYRWYADGQLISTDEDNVTHSFSSAGMHSISLAIVNGSICTDSTGIIMETKAKPFVVFNAPTTEIGNTTTFNVDVFNVDPTAIWYWDFDSDGIVDDTTPGNTSYLFADTGTYTTELIISDGDGCGTSYTREVTVVPLGMMPNVSFEANVSCVEKPVTFINLSTNIPAGALWSWDFNGDDLMDDDTSGNTEYTYTTGGDYTVTLSIALLSGEIISYSSEVTISEAPVADFEANTGCPGEPIIFTDLSQYAEASTWEWDFDGDGVVDSETPGDASFTYNEAGIYFATLILDNGLGCYDFKIKNIVIEDAPEALFSFTHFTSGSSAFVSFENASKGSDTYSWDFGDGSTSTDINPQHEFENFLGQTFEVCLTTTNGCTTDQYCESVLLTITGLETLDEAGIKAYPNPNEGQLFIDFTLADKGDYRIEIFDITGKRILNSSYNSFKSESIVEHQIDQPGNYLIRITSETWEVQQKLVVR